MAIPLNTIVSEPKLRANLEARLWPKIEKSGRFQCWRWISKSVHPFGYGRVSFGRSTQIKAHRAVYALTYGPIPDGQEVRHTCDHPWCCNPSHLELGTHTENVNDMLRRGRGAPPPVRFGEKHHNTKFDETTARRIAADLRSASVIAAENGVSAMTVYRLRRRKTWRLLD